MRTRTPKSRVEAAGAVTAASADEIPEPTPSGEATMNEDDVRGALRAIEQQLNDTFVSRSEAVRVILLGVLAQQNYLLVGPPGTAKTSVIDCFVKHVDVDVRFKILMGKFTQPEHVVGVLSIEAFKAGRYETVTAGMMTEAPLPILDETLKTSDGCMNSLLGILGPEREFQGKRTKNVCVGGATNWPEIDGLSKHVEALYDRFLLRCVVNPVDRTVDLRRALYRAAQKVSDYVPQQRVTVADLALATEHVHQVTIADEVIDLVDGVIARITAPIKGSDGKLRPSPVEISDRRATQLQQALRANAWLEGRTEVTVADFDVLRHGLWSKRADVEAVNAVIDSVDQHLVNDLVRKIDAARTAYRNLVNNGFGANAINAVSDKIKDTAYEVKQELLKPVFTKKGRDSVRDSMLNLRNDFNELDKKAKQLLGR